MLRLHLFQTPSIPAPLFDFPIRLTAGEMQPDPNEVRAIRILLYAIPLRVASGLWDGSLLALDQTRVFMNTAIVKSKKQIDPNMKVRIRHLREQHDPCPPGQLRFVVAKVHYADLEKVPAQGRRFGKMQASGAFDLVFFIRPPTGSVRKVEIVDFGLLAYSLMEQITDKYRILLQPTGRDRKRLRNAIDLEFLIRHYWSFLHENRQEILDVIRWKCGEWNVSPHAESMDDPDIRRVISEPGGGADSDSDRLPEIDPALKNVAAFYRTLSWG